jgi:7-cyano-7-deazaguanine synthase
MTQIQNNNKKTVVNILWTGGWDSTFRMLQLSTKDIIIQPFYILDDNRVSRNFELNAIRTITEDIRNLPSTQCTINDIIISNVSDIEEDKDITQSYKNLSKKYVIGPQYDWLARFSKNINNLEIGLDNGRAINNITVNAIKENGDLKRIVDNNKGEYFIIDKSVSSKDIINLWGNYHLPILFYLKLDMKKEAEEKGFIDIMNKTWFCHYPINNQPCGMCDTCRQVMDKGLGFRLSNTAHVRYRLRKILIPIKNTVIGKSMLKLWKIILYKINKY